MKIAFTTPEFVTERNFDGGLANYLNGVTSFLAAHYGYDVHVFTLSRTSETFRHHDITVHRVKRAGKPLRHRLLDIVTRPFFSQKLLSFYRARTDSRRIGVAVRGEHAAAPFGIVQAASYLHTGYDLTRLQPRPCPIVTRFSSSQQLLTTGYGRPYDPVTAVHTCFEALQGRLSDGCFCPSHVLRDHLLPLVGKTIDVIESPANVSLAHLDDSLYREHLRGKAYLLFYGTLGRLKGIEVLSRMLRGLLDTYPDLHFVFIGKDAGIGRGESAVGLLQRSAGDHASRILHFPPVPKDSLFPVVRNSLAVVLPSLVDNMPNTCIESMALGAVVVGTRGASFEQLITDGRNGFLCEPGDSSSLRSAVDKVMSLSAGQKAQTGQAARETTERLSPEKTVSTLVRYYTSIIAGLKQQRARAAAKEQQ